MKKVELNKGRYSSNHKIYKLEKTWERNSSVIGFFRNKHHNSNAMVVIQSKKFKKHHSEFTLSTNDHKDIEEMYSNHDGHEYGLPKFVIKFIAKWVKVKHDEYEASPLFAMDSASANMKENNDCTVKAIAIAAGVSYEKAHEVCKKHGRVNGQGLTYYPIIRALEEVSEIKSQLSGGSHRTGGISGEYLSAYNDKTVPTVDRMAASLGLKKLTFNRLPEVIKKDKNYIVMNCNHAAAVVGGEIIDWSKGKALQVTSLIELK